MSIAAVYPNGASTNRERGVFATEVAKPGLDGAITDWKTVKAPAPLHDESNAAIAAGRIYVIDDIGGLHSSPVDALGTTWRTEPLPPLPQ